MNFIQRGHLSLNFSQIYFRIPEKSRVATTGSATAALIEATLRAWSPFASRSLSSR